MDSVTLKLFCLSPQATIKDAMKRLNDTAHKSIFVADDGDRLVGIITDGDVRRGLLAGQSFISPVEQIMCREYAAVNVADPHASIRARELMLKHNVSLIPLLDNMDRVKDVLLWVDIFGAPKPSKERQPHDNKVVIMAGGKGTRLDIFTKIFPKPLIPVGDKPAIEIIMERFFRYGFHRFVYTLNHKKEYVKLFLKERSFPYDIDWVEERDFLGTAGSLPLMREKVDGTFFVVNCDTLIDVDFTEILKWHTAHNAALTVVGCHNEVSVPFGVVVLSNGRLERINEKPSHDVIINTGMYVMEPRVLSYLTEGQAVDMNTLINMVAEHEHVSVYPIDGRDWLDLGQWDSYQRSTKILEDKGYV